MGKDSRVRILVADNDARVRSALRILLKQEPGLCLVGESSDLESLLVQAKTFKPDLILMDWDLPGRPAAVLLFALYTLDFRPQVLVLSGRPELEQAVMAAGAHGFVSKIDPPERLLTALRRLMGNLAISRQPPPAVQGI